MKTTLRLATGIAATLVQPLAAKGSRDHRPPVSPPAEQSKVQIARRLNTSNSMDGLIDQTKTQLWKAVDIFVDTVRENQVDVTKPKPADLPAPLQNLTPAKFKQRIDQAANQRAGLQSRIRKRNKERETFIAAELRKQAGKEGKTLDEMLFETARTQPAALGHTL